MLENTHILVILAVLKLWSADSYDQSRIGSAEKFFGGSNNFAKAFQMTNSMSVKTFWSPKAIGEVLWLARGGNLHPWSIFLKESVQEG